MGAKMKSDKNSLVLLSSKMTKADTRIRADEAFALPSFPEVTPMFQMELPHRSCKEVAMEHHPEKDLEVLKQTMLKHEAMFREQVRELHRLYQVQRLLMAESKRKDSAIHTSSGPPSSNSSLVYSSDSFKPAGERSFWESIGGPINGFRQPLKDFATKPELVSPLDGQVQRNRSQEVIGNPEDLVNSKYRKVVRRTFDLERPAEEYMDVEAEEEKSIEEETSLKMTTSNMSQSRMTPFSQSPGSGREVHLSLSTGWDSGKRESYILNSTSSEENGRHNHFLLERPGGNEVPFFPMASSRTEIPSQEAVLRPTPILSTKSLLGGLLGLNHGSHLEDKPISGLQKSAIDEHEGRRNERRSLDPEAGERSTQENPKQPHWLLQRSVAVTKTPAGNPLTQSSGWHQPLPFFLQKQDELDMASKPALAPGEKGRPVVSQEQVKAGNAWSGGTSLHQGPVLGMAPQVRPSSGLSPTGGAGQGSYKISHQAGETINQGPVLGMSPQVRPSSGLSPTRGAGQGSYKISHQAGETINQSTPLPASVRDERGARLLPSGIYMSNYPSVSAVPADMQQPVLESHTALPAQMMFVPGLNSRGTVHGSTAQPWYQQNGLPPLMQQQQSAKLRSGGLPLAGQRTLQMPVHTGLVAAQQPAGAYEIRAAHPLGLTDDMGGNIYGMSKATDDGSNFLVHPVPVISRPEAPLYGMPKATDDVNNSVVHPVPVISRPETPLKRPAFESRVTTADVELTLGLSTNKRNETSEIQARDDDAACFAQIPRKQHENCGVVSFMGENFEGKPQRGKNQPVGTNNFYSEASCSGDIRTEENQKVFLQEVGTAMGAGAPEASTTKAPSQEDLQVLQVGFKQKGTALGELAGKELLFSDVVNAKSVLDGERISEYHLQEEPKLSEGQRQGGNYQQMAAEDCTKLLCQQEQVQSQIAPSLSQCKGQSSRKEGSALYKEASVEGAEYAFCGGAITPIESGSAGQGGLMTGKSLDVSATSCGIREAVFQKSCKATDAAKSESAEACQSHESGMAQCQGQNTVVGTELNGKLFQANKNTVCMSGQADLLVRSQQELNLSPKDPDVSMQCSPGLFKSFKSANVVKAEFHVTLKDHGDDRKVDESMKCLDEVSDHTNQAAEILLSLALDASSALEKGVVEDYVACTPERSLEWFANIIPREDDFEASMVVHANAAGIIQLPETSEGKSLAFEDDQLHRKDAVRNKQPGVEDEGLGPKEVQSPKKLDFFESVTLMLKASGLDSDELSPQVVDRWQMAGEGPSFSSHRGRSSRRGRLSRDFQREMLPSIASLSRQEITEDLQTIGGLMRSATEMVTRRTASFLSVKEDGSSSPTGLGSMRNWGGTRGNCGNAVTKSCRNDEQENQNGFPRISSWGYSARRRRMRRHRSRWSLLPPGVGMSSP